MNILAKEEKFELAKKIRDKLFALKHINDVALIKSEKLQEQEDSFRIESYDIAHMAGKEMVGVMVVVEHAEAQKSEYRKFKIKTVTSSNDPKALKEVIERRFEHKEWKLPNLIVVDGSTSQLNVVYDVLLKKGIKIPVVAVVKNERHKPKGILGNAILVKKYKQAILLANSEAHRFAVTFHRLVRKHNFIYTEN